MNIPHLKPIPRYLNDFLDWIDVEQGLSSKTQENYSRFLKLFLDWLEKEKLTNIKPSELTKEHIWDYKVFLSRHYKTKDGKQLKRVTQNFYLIALRSLLTFFADKDIPSLPPEKIKLTKQEEKPVHFLALDQVEKLLNEPKGKTKIGLRDKAILEVFFSTGMRVAELVSLNRNQIKIQPLTKDLEITIIGKGKRPRTVFFSEKTVQHLKKYLETRNDKEQALFINYSGREPGTRLKKRSMERTVKKYVISAGLPINTSCHTLRHSFATDLLNKGVDIRTVQEFLGHKNIVTTQIYTHVTRPQLRKIHRKCHSEK